MGLNMCYVYHYGHKTWLLLTGWSTGVRYFSSLPCPGKFWVLFHSTCIMVIFSKKIIQGPNICQHGIIFIDYQDPYSILGHLKNAFKGCWSSAGYAKLVSPENTGFYVKGIQHLAIQCDACLNAYGDFVRLGQIDLW